MKWLIRKVVKRGKGAVQYEEEIHFGEVLSLGRAANQAIFLNDLRAALEHATVTAIDNKRFRVESQIAAGVRVNGLIEQTATVKSGANIEIGSTRITLIDAPEGYEAAVEVSPIDKDEMAEKAKAAKLPTSLSETWLSRRSPSWILFAVTLAIGLLLPMALHFMPGVASATKNLPLPGRGIWQSGELAAAHHYFGQECQMCHDQAFQTVKDDKCLTCHSGTPAHANPQEFPLYELADARCAFCHRDHNGTEGMVETKQSLCSDCHRNLQERTRSESKMADVADFGKVHPEFQVNLPKWDENGKFAPVRTSLSNGPHKEESGLIFPHDLHLGTCKNTTDPKCKATLDGLRSPTGKRKLQCADCHKSEAGGAIMQPVDFETMCQECHSLAFDSSLPERQMPHANVAEVLFRLREFYAGAAMDGSYANRAANQANLPAVVRRRPGQRATPEERVEIRSWAADRTRQAIDSMFNGTCKDCHKVERNPGAEFDESYVVAPVRVVGQWYEKSRFTHAKHTTMSCDSCHQAKGSTVSTDLLIPGIDNCRSCHAGEGAVGKLGSTCIECHGFHEAEFRCVAARPRPPQRPPPAAQPAPAAPAGGAH